MTGTSDMNSTPPATATWQASVLRNPAQVATAASEEAQAMATVCAEWARGGRPADRADSRATLRTLRGGPRVKMLCASHLPNQCWHHQRHSEDARR